MSDREVVSVVRGDISKRTRFIVTRGHTVVQGGGSMFDRSVVTFSRDHEGLVFEAVEIVGPVIAARVIACAEAWRKDLVGKVRMVNTTDTQTMPVPDEFYEAMPFKVSGG